MAKVDSDRVIAQQAKENAALKAELKAQKSIDLKDQIDWGKELLNITEKRTSALREASKISVGQKELDKEIAEYINFAVDNQKWLNKEDNKYLRSLIKELKLQKNQFKEVEKTQLQIAKIADIEKKALPHRKKLVESQEKLNKLSEQYEGSAKKSVSFLGDIDDKIKEIPIVGDFLSKAIGLDAIGKEITKKFTDTLINALDPATAAQAAASAEALAGYEAQIAAQEVLAVETGIVAVEEGVIAAEVGAAAAETVALTAGTLTAGVAATGFATAMGVAAAAAWAAMAPMLPLIAVAAALLATIMLIKKALDVDEEISNLAKGMGQTKHEAEEAHQQFAEIAANTEIIGANIESLSKANTDLNAILGTNVTASKEMLEAQVLLTKQYGLTGEEAAEFQAVSAGTGKTVNQNLATVEAMVEGYNTMTGDSLNFKEISKDIAKTSKATLASYKGNVKALTLAAIQAKKMGMSLEDTQHVADNLLDIETSVENEMKANVLTGKHMNMNKARQLAYEGKTAEAAAEAVSQAGSLSELNDMHMVQRKAIADAAGVSVDQLMKSAELQEYSNALNGAEITDMKDLTAEQIHQLEIAGAIDKTKADQLMKDQQIASTNEKMARIGDKLSALMMKAVGPIVDMLDPLMELVDFVFPLLERTMAGPIKSFKIVFTVVGGIIKAVSYLAGVIKRLGSMINDALGNPLGEIVDFFKGIGNSISNFFGGIFDYFSERINNMLPDWALKLLDIGPSNKESEASHQKVDDAMIAPNGGLVVSGQKGSFQLNSQDSVVAGTSLGEQKDDAPSDFSNWWDSMTGGDDNAEIVSLLRELIAKVEQPVMVNIGGRVVDEMEKQTSLRRTYNTKMDSGYGTFG